jgi:hypothetical protein
MLIEGSHFCKDFVIAQHSFFSAVLQRSPELFERLSASATEVVR